MTLDELHSFFFDVETLLETEHSDDAWTAKDLLKAMQEIMTRKFVDQYR